MLREATNTVNIEGIISEIDIKDRDFVKNGETKEAISGVIKVRVNQKVGGEMKELEVPVHVFSTKYTKSGAVNPSYASIDKFRNNATSIAAAGGVEGADWVQIRSGKITMNEFYSQDGSKLNSYPRIQASFLNKLPPKDIKDSMATFTIEFMVAKKEYEVDKNGEETGRYKIKAAVPQYGGKVDSIAFVADSVGVIDAIQSYWEEGKTYSATGRINFSAKTEVTYIQSDFGDDPIRSERTVSVNELIITGGSQTPLDENNEFSIEDIKRGLKERQARLEEMKNKMTQPKSSKNISDDLGF